MSSERRFARLDGRRCGPAEDRRAKRSGTGKTRVPRGVTWGAWGDMWVLRCLFLGYLLNLVNGICGQGELVPRRCCLHPASYRGRGVRMGPFYIYIGVADVARR